MLGAAYVAELTQLGRRAGLDAIGIAPAQPFSDTRRHLQERRRAGLHGGMAFTYRNPERSTDPSRTLPGVAAIVVAALAYDHDQDVLDGPDRGLPVRSRPIPDSGASSRPPRGPASTTGRVAAYARADYYAELRAGLDVIAARLRADGWRCRIAVDDNALVDREAAYRAGLGWYGKNANLLLPGRGSWFVLGSVLTDAPLPAAEAVVEDGCGPCRRCIDACPTGAIVAPGVIDARRCLAWLVQAEGSFPHEFRAALGDRIYGCDDCQTACPINRVGDRRAGTRAESHRRAPSRANGGVGPGPELDVDVLELLTASDNELLDRYGRWYIPRRDPRYLRRNALVVLGNIGDPGDPAVVDVVQRYCVDADPMLREHAEWAADRLGVAVGLAVKPPVPAPEAAPAPAPVAPV